MKKTEGTVIGVNGNMISVSFTGDVKMNEVAYVKTGEARLKSEVIRINGNRAELQVFEITGGIKAGDFVEFSGDLLAVQLGPGLLGQIYDGLQNPLPRLAEKCGFFPAAGGLSGCPLPGGKVAVQTRCHGEPPPEKRRCHRNGSGGVL